MKTCSKCKETREESLFRKNKNSKDKLSCQCKYCMASFPYAEIVNLEGEIWKPIPEYKAYLISNKGRVKRIAPGLPILLKPMLCQGYYYISIQGHGKRIHSLVLEAFVGERPSLKMHIDHIDGNKLNNCLENLEYVTCKENSRRARELGLVAKNTNSKLSDQQVLDIRRLLGEGSSGVQLAETFNVSQKLISNIKSNKTYKTITLND